MALPGQHAQVHSCRKKGARHLPRAPAVQAPRTVARARPEPRKCPTPLLGERASPGPQPPVTGERAQKPPKNNGAHKGLAVHPLTAQPVTLPYTQAQVPIPH
jgi:hypothetical protein